MTPKSIQKYQQLGNYHHSLGISLRLLKFDAVLTSFRLKKRERIMHQIATIFFITWSLLFFGNTINAQESRVSAKEALEYFSNGDFEKAIPIYKALLDRYNHEPKYNYYYGVCLIKQRENNSEAIKRLKFASLKNVNRDAFYYLGIAYQNEYEFEEAIKQYTRFLKITHAEDARRTITQRSIEDCKSAIDLINKYFQISILSKDTVPEEEVLSRYHLSGESGTLSHNRSFFKTGVDPDQIMYKTELENEVLFVLEQPDTSRYNINKMDKLLDSWSKSHDLGSPINTEYDERHPFMLVDGTTFYFSSDRPGGMGGMDIYQSFFDPESNTFSNPENLGPPYNSPADDYLFAADAFENQAWFTTNRGVNPGKTVVVKIRWDNSVIKNLARDTEQIRQLAQLPLHETDSSLAQTAQPIGSNNQPLKNKEDFSFYINDTLIYTRFEHFMSAQALNEFKMGFDLSAQKDSLDQLMDHKRKIYSQSYNKDELTQLIDEILKLEKQVYGLSDKIQIHHLQSRQLETSKILELKAKGTYHGIQKNQETSTKTGTSEFINTNIIHFESAEKFQGPKKEIRAMYHKYFSSNEIIALEQADSLYAWANVLKLKAAKMLERGIQPASPENTLSLLDRIKNKDSLSNTEEPEINYTDEAQATEKEALDIYHQALDKKYRIYYQKLTQLWGEQQNNALEDSLGQIRAYYDEATEGLEKMYSYNQERYEMLGSLKRKAVTLMEQALIRHSPPIHAQSQAYLIPEPDSKGRSSAECQISQKNHPEVTKRVTPLTLSPEKIVASAFNQSGKLIYKVQIGVFGSTPKQESLDKIPAISISPVAGKKLTKYYSGQWNTFEKAQKQVVAIRKAGFEGAFVVAFQDGQPIPIEKAKTISQEQTKTQ